MKKPDDSKFAEVMAILKIMSAQSETARQKELADVSYDRFCGWKYFGDIKSGESHVANQKQEGKDTL